MLRAGAGVLQRHCSLSIVALQRCERYALGVQAVLTADSCAKLQAVSISRQPAHPENVVRSVELDTSPLQGAALCAAPNAVVLRTAVSAPNCRKR